MYVTTNGASTGSVFINLTFTTGRNDPPPAAAGVRVPAPEPLPHGTLRWTARRLDQDQDREAIGADHRR
jgi:hypothetical protein